MATTTTTTMAELTAMATTGTVEPKACLRRHPPLPCQTNAKDATSLWTNIRARPDTAICP
eukprot:9162805-Lingulodinium_polyedra.AAC.1